MSRLTLSLAAAQLHGMGDGNKLLDEFFASFPG